jgi:DNA-directed RNA polymerase
MNLNQGKIKIKFFKHIYVVFFFSYSEYARVDDSQKQTMKLLNDTLRHVPKRGTFQLNSVIDSTYFFS